jgi:hypothetical protein
LPKDQQTYDWDAVDKNLLELTKNPGSVLETQGKLKEALVLNPTIGNVDKLMADSKEYFTPMTADPVSMTPDPKQLLLRKKEMKDFFRSGKLKPEHIKALEKEKARAEALNPDNEDLKVMPLDEFFAENYTDKGFLKRSKPTVRSAGSTTKPTFNVGGANVSVPAGTRGTNNKLYGGINYNDRYDFGMKTTPIKINVKNGMQYIEKSDPKDPGRTGWRKIDTGGLSGDVEGVIQFYDVKTDSFIGRSNADANLPYVDNDVTFSVPRVNVENSEKFPIILPDGKQGTLKDILPASETFGVSKRNVNSGIKWK